MAKMVPFLNPTSRGGSVLFGGPKNFDFLSVLRNAVNVKCALAFGHMSGWRKIDAALRSSSTKGIQVLLGQAFFQTEPDLLDCIRKREEKTGWFQGRLASVRPTFHPKVWLIETLATTQAIVGSANLSYGGFVDNVECSAFITDPDTVHLLIEWFDMLWTQSSVLTPDLCKVYREQYDKTQVLRSSLQKAIDGATEEVERAQFAWSRKEAVEEARVFFGTLGGKKAAEERLEAILRIRKCLKPPGFAFTAADWIEFLHIPEFGSLNRIPRDTAKRIFQIRKAFLYLADERVPLATRINDVVPDGSRFHVHRIGKNIVTKVMAMLHPEEMPVYNERVELTLKAYGYPLDAATTFGERYETFCREVKSFVRECGQEEVISIDSFFEHRSRQSDADR